VVLPQQLQKNFNFSTGVDKAGTVVVIIRPLGVETNAIRAVNEVPTPTGVACQSQADVFFHRGFINGFFVFETGTGGGLAPLQSPFLF
jgi:citrate lyase alpha subunit